MRSLAWQRDSAGVIKVTDQLTSGSGEDLDHPDGPNQRTGARTARVGGRSQRQALLGLKREAANCHPEPPRARHHVTKSCQHIGPQIKPKPPLTRCGLDSPEQSRQLSCAPTPGHRAARDKRVLLTATKSTATGQGSKRKQALQPKRTLPAQRPQTLNKPQTEDTGGEPRRHIIIKLLKTRDKERI